MELSPSALLDFGAEFLRFPINERFLDIVFLGLSGIFSPFLFLFSRLSNAVRHLPDTHFVIQSTSG